MTTEHGEVSFSRLSFNDTDGSMKYGGVVVGDDSVDLFGEYEVYYEVESNSGIYINQYSTFSFDFDGVSNDDVKICLYEDLDVSVLNLCPTRCVTPSGGNNVQVQLGFMFHYREVVVKYISFKQVSDSAERTITSFSDLLRSRFKSLKIVTGSADRQITDGRCHDPNAQFVYIRNSTRSTIDEACKCMDGYVSSTTAKRIQGRFDSCTSCIPDYLPLCPVDSASLLSAYSSGVCAPKMGILIENADFDRRAEIKADLIPSSTVLDTLHFIGGSILSASGGGILLYGNAMATYRLKQEVPLRGDARIKFNFTLPNYSTSTSRNEYFTAVCLSDRPISWTAGGTQSRSTNQICVHISESSSLPVFVPADSSQWLVPFSILSGKYSTQSSVGDTSTGLIRTSSDQDPWWEIDLEGQFRIQRITIYRDSPSAIGSLGTFTLTLYQSGCSGSKSGVGTFGYVKVVEESDQDRIEVQIPTSHMYSCIRVQQNGAEESVLAFYKMEVDEYTFGPTRSYDIPIGRMLISTHGSDEDVRMSYITFINYSSDENSIESRGYFDGIRLIYSDVSWFEDTTHPSVSVQPSPTPSFSTYPSLWPSNDPSTGPTDRPSSSNPSVSSTVPTDIPSVSPPPSPIPTVTSDPSLSPLPSDQESSAVSS